MARHGFRSREAAEDASQVVGGKVFQVAHFDWLLLFLARGQRAGKW